MKFTTAFYRYNMVRLDESFSTEAEAREAAIELDKRLDYGYNGIAFIIAEHSMQVAHVGNGQLRIDDNEYGKALEWLTASDSVRAVVEGRNKKASGL